MAYHDDVCECCGEHLDYSECFGVMECDRCGEDVCDYIEYKGAIGCKKCIETIKEMRDDKLNNHPLDFNFLNKTDNVI